MTTPPEWALARARETASVYHTKYYGRVACGHPCCFCEDIAPLFARVIAVAVVDAREQAARVAGEWEPASGEAHGMHPNDVRDDIEAGIRSLEGDPAK